MAENHINAISKSNERYEVNEGCKLIVIATMNLDVSGIHRLQDAFDDRFEIFIPLLYPKKEKEREILIEITGADKKQVNLVVDLAQELRKGARQLSLSKHFSTRIGVNFLKIVNSIPVKWAEKTIDAAIIQKLSQDEKDIQYINDVLFGKDFIKKFKETFN